VVGGGATSGSTSVSHIARQMAAYYADDDVVAIVIASKEVALLTGCLAYNVFGGMLNLANQSINQSSWTFYRRLLTMQS